MNTNRSLIIITVSAIVLSTLGIVALAESSVNPAKKQLLSEDPALVKRGNYIVNKVGLCIDCHSPRGERGEFIEGKHLTGSMIGVAPLGPMPAWATAAPAIAGMPAGWSEEGMAHFLMTGERPNNLPPVRPPMPPYRLSQPDAEAVVAYLHSLKSGAQ